MILGEGAPTRPDSICERYPLEIPLAASTCLRDRPSRSLSSCRRDPNWFGLVTTWDSSCQVLLPGSCTVGAHVCSERAASAAGREYLTGIVSVLRQFTSAVPKIHRALKKSSRRSPHCARCPMSILQNATFMFSEDAFTAHVRTMDHRGFARRGSVGTS